MPKHKGKSVSFYSRHEALKAAETLLQLMHQMVESREITMGNCTVDFSEGGQMKTAEFDPLEYVDFAAKGVEEAIKDATDGTKTPNDGKQHAHSHN